MYAIRLRKKRTKNYAEQNVFARTKLLTIETNQRTAKYIQQKQRDLVIYLFFYYVSSEGKVSRDDKAPCA